MDVLEHSFPADLVVLPLPFVDLSTAVIEDAMLNLGLPISMPQTLFELSFVSQLGFIECHSCPVQPCSALVVHLDGVLPYIQIKRTDIFLEDPLQRHPVGQILGTSLFDLLGLDRQ